MDWIAEILLAVLLAGLAGVTWVSLNRARRARRRLATDLHDKALALDRRCDVLQEQVGNIDEEQRIAHLFTLVTWGESEGRFDSDVARGLRRHALQLRGESFARRKGA